MQLGETHEAERKEPRGCIGNGVGAGAGAELEGFGGGGYPWNVLSGDQLCPEVEQAQPLGVSAMGA